MSAVSFELQMLVPARSKVTDSSSVFGCVFLVYVRQEYLMMIRCFIHSVLELKYP